tara:strand:+ start:42 stop:926 length:885 start_codon:yes stop_codon:yes gene_type:complete
VSIPTRGLIFKDSVDKVRDTVARPSLDTFYEVEFSFGKYQTWLGREPGLRRTQSNSFRKKMSLLCTQAEIPGTSFIESSVTGNYQGITELFPNLRNFPPLNLTFYVDADHVILEVLETWMTYINPIANGVDSPRAYAVFNYPEDYKETIHLTKFERDTFIKESRAASYQSDMTSYEFVNVWPTNLTSMRVAYGDSNVLRCTIQFAYDRFHTTFSYPDVRRQAIGEPAGIINSKDIKASASTEFKPKNTYEDNRRKLNASRNKRRAEVNALMDDTGLNRRDAQRISAGGSVETSY